MVLTGVVVIGLSRSTEGDDLFRWSPNSEISATDETRPRAAAGKEQAGAASDAAGEPTTTRPRDPDSRAAAGTSTASRNTNVDMEDLLFKELPAPVVSSATKIEQPIYEAPSAITVITAEDIRRMGARRLTDVFRWTPGLDVFAATSNKSTVSARGVYAPRIEVTNEMLVLIDGRSVYADFLGGVDWEALPVFLEEIERIEIILGPSGSLYGPNAFAGTISIFTKRKPEAGILRTTIGTNHFFESNLIEWLYGEDYEFRLGVGWHEDEGFGTSGGRDFLDDKGLKKINLFAHFQLDGDHDLELRGGWLTGHRSFNEDFFEGGGRENTDTGYSQVLFEHRFSGDAKLRAQYYHNQGRATQ